MIHVFDEGRFGEIIQKGIGGIGKLVVFVDKPPGIVVLEFIVEHQDESAQMEQVAGG